MKHSTRLALLASAAALLPTLGMATTLGAWNLDNVVPGPVPSPDETEFSVIYQGDPATAETNGRIAYTDPEAVTPGLLALNDLYTSGQGTFDGCIRASTGDDECATGFRTGNRFKLQMTDTGAIDLVFDIDPTAAGTQGGTDADGNLLTLGVNTYQVFGRAVNLTTQMLDGFIVELGFGVGDGFVASAEGDGLKFAQGLELGPNNLPVFTQYPFGLFGEADDNPRFTLDGFFDDERAGFNVAFDGEDTIRSAGLYGGIRATSPGSATGYRKKWPHRACCGMMMTTPAPTRWSWRG